MARRPRQDSPGSWHHVVNRGIAKRALFESRSELRFFLSRIALQVRQKRIEVHAYCLLTTHYHLLIRSPIGELPEAMRRIQSAYSRHFNRRHHRDGSLIRGRYFSKPIQSIEYRQAVLRYIDQNPVSAGLVTKPSDYEFSSAAHYNRICGPPWLTRSWVEGVIARRAQSARESATRSDDSKDSKWAMGAAELATFVDAHTFGRTPSGSEPEILSLATDGVRKWLQRKARLADGHKVGLPVCTPTAVHIAMDETLKELGPWMVVDGLKTYQGSKLAAAGLLHDLCGLTWAQVAELESDTTSRVRRLAELSYRWMRESPEYFDRIVQITDLANRLMRRWVS